VIDPETRAKVTSREDLTLVVEHPDEEASGSRSLAVHADGTRVCRDVPAGCAWRVEKEGFAPTHADAVTKDIAADLGVGCVSVDADGVACATFGVNGSLGAVCASEAGLVAFVPGDDSEGNTGDDRQTPLARAKRALRAAATPEGERRGVGDVGAGDPDVDGAFIFDLRRGAVRFVDEAARRKEIGFVPFRKSGKENASLPEAEPSVGGASVATDDGLGPSASRACVGDDDDADPELSGEKEMKPATPAAFVARAHEFRAACAFAELDPPPPPPEEPEEGTEEGEEGGADEQRNAAGEDAGEDEKTPSPEEAAADATAASPGNDEKSPVAAEPSSTTTATLATTVVVDEPPTRVVVNAPLVPPRVFVAYPDQNEYFEVLSEAAFSSYRAERLNDASCAADAAPVAGAEAGSGAVSHTFLTPLRPAPCAPRADARARAECQTSDDGEGRPESGAQPARTLHAAVPRGAGDAPRAAHRRGGRDDFKDVKRLFHERFKRFENVRVPADHRVPETVGRGGKRHRRGVTKRGGCVAGDDARGARVVPPERRAL
jgi:hypothetical protein